MSYIETGSFKFGDTDMYDTYGIQILDSSMPEDLLLPAIRPRKVTLPFRHGAYDYGAKYYDERHLVLNCIALNDARTFARDLAYTLSTKDKIRLWNEPHLYYIGRIENEVALTPYRDVGVTFTLDFTCDPFAYGNTVTEQFNGLRYVTHYQGTVPSPTKIIVKNNSQNTISTIKITQLKKED